MCEMKVEVFQVIKTIITSIILVPLWNENPPPKLILEINALGQTCYVTFMNIIFFNTIDTKLILNEYLKGKSCFLPKL